MYVLTTEYERSLRRKMGCHINLNHQIVFMQLSISKYSLIFDIWLQSGMYTVTDSIVLQKNLYDFLLSHKNII